MLLVRWQQKTYPQMKCVGGEPAKKINTLEAFAEKCLEQTSEYNYQEYKTNREIVIKELFDK